MGLGWAPALPRVNAEPKPGAKAAPGRAIRVSGRAVGHVQPPAPGPRGGMAGAGSDGDGSRAPRGCLEVGMNVRLGD